MHRFLLFFLFLSLPLAAQSFDELMDLGVDAMVNEEYPLAQYYFGLAAEQQPANPLPEIYLSTISRLVKIEQGENAQEVDQFIEEKEREREVGDEQDEQLTVNPDLEEDFIYQQEQKEIARKERPLYSFMLSMPFSISGDSRFNTDNQDFSDKGIFYPGYHLDGYYFPDFLRRQFGVGVDLQKVMVPMEDDFVGLSNLYLNIQFRNYIGEKPGVRMVLGTRVGVGLTLVENQIPNEMETLTTWGVAVFYSDSLLYRLGMQGLAPLVFKGHGLIRYGENYSAVEFQAGMVYSMERIDWGFLWDYGYQINWGEYEYHPWSLSFVLGQNL